ncbi:hypothetical protein T492DRAFT_40206 [Pavlovales sp. CCMP2436]|nr:hypothetical protein T492DRAFT_40206 [Pavlovales sp. CCMP2436]
MIVDKLIPNTTYLNHNCSADTTVPTARVALERLLNQTEENLEFAAVVSGTSHENAGQMFLEAAVELERPPSKCAVISSTLSSVLQAHEVLMKVSIAHARTHTHQPTHTHARAHTHVHTHAHTHTHTRTHAHAHARARAHTHTHAHTDTPTHTHIHTHICTQIRMHPCTHIHGELIQVREVLIQFSFHCWLANSNRMLRKGSLFS